MISFHRSKNRVLLPSTLGDSWLNNCCCADSSLDGCAGVTPNCAQKGVRNGKGNAYERLADNGSLKWKQITTGTRKWYVTFDF